MKIYKLKIFFAEIDYYWKGFLPLQKALDFSFIEESLQKPVEDNYSLFIKEFPYPPYKVDEIVTVLFIEYLPLLTLFSFIFLCPAILKRVVEEKHTGTKVLVWKLEVMTCIFKYL